MECIHSYDIDFDREAMNQKVLKSISKLPDGMRKEIRLLAKQYLIIEVYQEPPVTCNKFMIRESSWFVKYKHFGYDNEEFIWEIK